METFLKFLFGRIPDCQYLSLEVECLACHRGIEVHLHGSLVHFQDFSRDDISASVEHRYGCTRYKEVLLYFSVHFECLHRKVDDPVRIDLSVGLVRRKGKLKSAPRLKTCDIFFELVQQRPCAVDIVKRSFLCGPVDDLAVNFKLIAELHNLVVFDFHRVCFNSKNYHQYICAASGGPHCRIPGGCPFYMVLSMPDRQSRR